MEACHRGAALKEVYHQMEACRSMEACHRGAALKEVYRQMEAYRSKEAYHRGAALMAYRQKAAYPQVVQRVVVRGSLSFSMNFEIARKTGCHQTGWNYGRSRHDCHPCSRHFAHRHAHRHAFGHRPVENSGVTPRP